MRHRARELPRHRLARGVTVRASRARTLARMQLERRHQQPSGARVWPGGTPPLQVADGPDAQPGPFGEVLLAEPGSDTLPPHPGAELPGIVILAGHEDRPRHKVFAEEQEKYPTVTRSPGPGTATARQHRVALGWAALDDAAARSLPVVRRFSTWQHLAVMLNVGANRPVPSAVHTAAQHAEQRRAVRSCSRRGRHGGRHRRWHPANQAPPPSRHPVPMAALPTVLIVSLLVAACAGRRPSNCDNDG
jgi:hypothetical protein